MRGPGLVRLVGELELGIDSERLRLPLAPLGLLLVEGAPRRYVDRAVRTAMREVWDEGLHRAVVSALYGVPLGYGYEAAEDLYRRGPRSPVARLVVLRFARELMDEHGADVATLERFEQALQEASSGDARAISLQVARVAGPGATIPPRELATALAAVLGTDRRRQGARDWLAAVAGQLAVRFPLLAAALRELIDEPVPEQAADDALWVSATEGLIATHANRRATGTDK